MKRRHLTFFAGTLFLFGCILFGLTNCASPKKNLSAGTSKVKITPTTPIPMSGYSSRTEPFQGIHDDLFARIIVFSDGENKAAIIAADIIGFSEDQWEEITKSVGIKTGINQEYILLCATHTHGGPNNRINEKSSKAAIDYANELKQKIIDAVIEADKNLKPASIGAGKGECLMNINRRAVNGRGGIRLGRNPYEPCDHEVGVIRIDNENKTPMAILINWPSHATTMGSRNYLISGDWPGAAARFIEKQFDNGMIAPITAGSCGNINPIYGPVSDFTMSYSFGVDAIGAILGEEAVKVAENIKTNSFAPISAVQRVITVPGKERTSDKDFNKLGTKAFKPGPDAILRLSVLKIGDIVFAGVAQEFNEIGTQIKNASPNKYTFVVDHCNASSNYVPTDEAYELGGYEVMVTRLMPGAEKIIIKNIIDMINEF